MAEAWTRPEPGKPLKEWPRGWFWTAVFITCLFSFNGGWVNSIAFLGIWRTGLTHLTGLTTNGAIRVINPAKPGQITEIMYIIYIMGFYTGATIAGFILAKPRTRWGKLQALVLLLNGCYLFFGWFFAESQTVFAGFLIAGAMGAQNAITSLFAPMTLRNSHVSGHVLDLGIATGQTLRNMNGDNLFKIQINLPTYTSFWAGALCGTIVYNRLLLDALLMSSGACFLVGGLTIALVTLFNMYVDGKPPSPPPEELAMEDYDPMDEEDNEVHAKFK